MKIIRRAVFQMTPTIGEYLPLESDTLESYTGPVSLAKTSTPKPPPAPDYIAAAREQGIQNQEAARLAAQLNRVNQTGPVGSTTYTDLGNDQWQRTDTLSPELQELFNQQTGATGQAYRDFAARPDFDFTQLPQRVAGVQGSNFQTDINAPRVGQTELDLSPLEAFNLESDFSGDRQRVEDALYRRSTNILDPQYEQRLGAERSRLSGQGLAEGSEAYNTALANFDRERRETYGDARDRAIGAGGAEQSRLLGETRASRGQRYGEILGAGQFGNQATNQQFQNELAAAGFGNAAQADTFQQGVTNAALADQARSAGIEEQAMLRSDPLRELLALQGGGYQPPNMGTGAPQVAGPEAAPIYDATGQQYQSQIDLFNQRMAGRNQNLQSMAGLGAALIGLFSDRRLKRDIEYVRTTPDGHRIYRYRYIFADGWKLGVMSDEVAKYAPWAVFKVLGFDMVNYTVLGLEELTRMPSAEVQGLKLAEVGA